MLETAVMNQRVGAAYIAQSRRRLGACRDRIKHCLGQLDEAQMWWRPDESMNSVANIILHLCGNLRQWIVSGIGGAADIRDRPSEFSDRRQLPKLELVRRFDEIVDEADAVLASVTETQLLDPRRIQGFDETVLSAIFDTLAHLSGHTQEIVFMTRLQLRNAYQFAWKPATPEEGAPV